MSSKPAQRWWAWGLMAVVVVGALMVGLSDDDADRTTDDRLFSLAETIKCPTCRSQSVAESEAPIAKEIRALMADRIEAGQSDEEIRTFLVSRFGEEVLLTPSSSGVTGLVWVIPVIAGLAGLTALVFTFRRWQRTEPVAATAADRDVVAAARAESEGDDGDA